MKDLMSRTLFIILLLSVCASLHATEPAARKPYGVTIGLATEPDMLNPTNARTVEAKYIESQIFQSLTAINPITHLEEPILAESLPTVSYDSIADVTRYSYHIRKDAKWDNGQSINARDVIFSAKVFKCPAINMNPLWEYYKPIRDVQTDAKDSLKVTFICAKKSMMSQSLCGQLYIIPQYVYDGAHLMDSFSVSYFDKNPDTLKNDLWVQAFWIGYIHIRHERVKGSVVGSGPYEYEEWRPERYVILNKKKNWWGDKHSGSGYFFEAYPDTLTYEIIKDPQEMVSALHSKSIDVAYGLKTPVFIELKASADISSDYTLYTPPSLSYQYMGVNMKLPKFRDVRTRQAIAHLVDVDRMIKEVAAGYGIRTVGPINPDKKAVYNDTIPPYDLNIPKAKALLAAVGWKDRDGDGVLDMDIDGVKTDLSIELTIPQGNEGRRMSGVIFQEEAKKAGVKVEIVPQEIAVFMENQSHHKFEMNYGAWIGSLNPDELGILFHRGSYNNGNYVGFGDEESDHLLEKILFELNELKRNILYKRFQEITHEQVPYVFLYAPLSKIIISKRFENVQTFGAAPGFNPACFKLKP